MAEESSAENRVRIAMISSNVRLAERVRKIADRRAIPIEIRIGTLEAAIPVGRQLEAEGIEAIICRGGTSDILKRAVSVPVVSIPLLSTFDLLEDISEAAKFGSHIGVSVYNEPLTGVDIIEKLLHVKIKQVIYTDSENLFDGIQRAKKEGIDVYIGGNFASEICRALGLPCVYFGISEERVVNAINEAISIACVRREEKEKTKRVEAILNSVSEGMIAIDGHGRISLFNQVAEELLGVKGGLGRHVDEVVPEMGLCEILRTGKPRLQKLQKIGEVQILANLVPVHLDRKVIGATASFSDVSKVMRAEQKVRRSFTKGFVTQYTLEDVICQSPVMKRVLTKTRQFSLSDSTILITGESGTGKELIAHSIHSLSPREKGPFVAINCSALPENLLESELFGYEDGAFTGARKGGKPGLFELAHQGSVFLDEIGSVSATVQSRLLRVLQQKEVMRIGGDRIIPVDVRVIAATNVDLLQMVKQGQMRMDLYFRLNILRIHLPPLRERKEDIPLLVGEFLAQQSERYAKPLPHLPEKLMQRFLAHSWPGNIRELINHIEKFVLMADTPDRYGEVLDKLFEECLTLERILFGQEEPETAPLKGRLGNPLYKKKAIAKMMGVSRTTLWRREQKEMQHET
ncbi:MAG: sigma 54-interacting transcriptional regulator [Deltaproteobacteria bacterium]|nr:sigma 54-interacting transcriptional regulator [Deltaproteobacteria bacterium]